MDELTQFVEHNIGKKAHLKTKTGIYLRFVTIHKKHPNMCRVGWIVECSLLDEYGLECGQKVSSEKQ